MLSLHVHTEPDKAVAYHDDHLKKSAASDYYSQGDPALGSFFGKGLAPMGMEGEPYSRAAFSHLCHNRNPLTRQQLTARRKEGARVGYDGTISAPKSVSAMALVLDDPRVLAAHTAGVAASLDFLERRAMTRVRVDGECSDRLTGNLVGARFQHFTSRHDDPQLHDHCLMFNATFDPVENRWKALQSSGIYGASALATEIYRSTVAAELHKIGYRTRPTANGFEIEGVPQEVIDLFSKRRREILKIAKDLGQEHNPNALAAIARSSRKAKSASVSVSKLRDSWQAQLSPQQLASLQALKDSATGPVDQPAVSPDEALDWAKRHLFERLSVVSHDELLTESIRHARGHFTEEQLCDAITEATAKGILIGRGSDFTTPEAVTNEQELIALINGGRDGFSPLNEHFHISGNLTPEQREVVGQTLLSPDRTTAIHGPAGAGKTTTLQELVRGLRTASYRVVMLAPSGAAANVLREEGFSGAATLQRFLLDERAQANAAGGVVILDEAGMVSVGQMLDLSRLAEEQDFRVVLVGDSKQHRSVEAGDALLLLEAHSSLRRASLKTIFRQKHERYREAISDIKDGRPLAGFDTLDSLGWVRELPDSSAADRGALLAADFASVIKRGQSALAVSATWREAQEVTTGIRQALREQGVIKGEEVVVQSLVPLHRTEAERELPHLFAKGQVLDFQRDSSLFDRGEQVSVLKQQDGLLLVERANKETVLFDPKKSATAFQVFERQPLPIAAGDKLLLRANDKGKGVKLINGQIVTIKSIEDGVISLSDGRILPRDFRCFAHGYCISSQASQGKTVDHVFVAIDAQSAHSATSLETFYVAASRARHSCTIVTDAKKELRAAIRHSAARTAAIELLAEINQPTPHYERTTRTTQKEPVPNDGPLAHPPGRHPLHRHSPARARTDALDRSLPPHPRSGGSEDELFHRTTRDPHLSGRGTSHDSVPSLRLKGHAPDLG